MVVNEIGRGRVESIHRSPGGVPKQPIPWVRVLDDRVEGDDHNDKEGHGGPDRAVCLFSKEVIDALKAEGNPIFPGSTGENVTLSGLPWAQVVPGTRLTVGNVELEVTKYASPCKTISGSFVDGYFNRISHKLFPGWSRIYAKVVTPGEITVGDEVIAEGPAI